MIGEVTLFHGFAVTIVGLTLRNMILYSFLRDSWFLQGQALTSYYYGFSMNCRGSPVVLVKNVYDQDLP